MMRSLEVRCGIPVGRVSMQRYIGSVLTSWNRFLTALLDGVN